MKANALRVSILLLLAVTTLHAQTGSRISMEVFRGLEFRSIGPSLTTGRISDLEIDPNNSNVWYLTVDFKVRDTPCGQAWAYAAELKATEDFH